MRYRNCTNNLALQMISSRIFRLIHTDNYLWQATSKSLLAKLRKKTGYGFSKCKAALEKHSNDIEKAEAWLQEEAKQHGWSQADKLQSRKTLQGLIAVTADKNCGALVEINCETDFAARNKKFHGLAEIVATTALRHASTLETNGDIKKSIIYTEVLKNLSTPDGMTLGDHSALTIGSLGENIRIRRALCMKVQPNTEVYGCTHPSTVNPVPVSFGKYGALLALQTKDSNGQLGTQLCQHIIGMNPGKIGDPLKDVPNESVEHESCMIFQEYLLDPNLTVQQMLTETETVILDFARFETGEVLEGEQILESVETCG